MRTSSLSSGTLTGLAIAICVYLVLPTLAIVPLSFTRSDFISFPPDGFSFRWYELFFGAGVWRNSMITSLITALCSATLATVIGTMAAVALQKMSSRQARIAIWFILLPMIVPSIVIAVALYSMFARIGVNGTYAGIVIAHTIITLPFVVINVSAVMQKMDWRIVNAARSLGATPFEAFCKVTVRAILPGIIAGAIFAFLTSFDEVVVALFITGIDTVTLPVQMWNGIRFEISPAVAAVACTMLGLSIILLALYSAAQRRSVSRA